MEGGATTGGDGERLGTRLLAVGEELVHEPPAHPGANPNANETNAEILFLRICGQARVQVGTQVRNFLSTLEFRNPGRK